MIDDFKEAEPDKEFVEIVTHFEDKYKCSGLCDTSLFYYTQSITEGPPTRACLLPAVDDISKSMQNLGTLFILTGILFFFMIFISIPICCFN
jgi:hypothetical protein